MELILTIVVPYEASSVDVSSGFPLANINIVVFTTEKITGLDEMFLCSIYYIPQCILVVI